MKRDLDLIRRLLLDIEAASDAHEGHRGWNRAADDGVEPEHLYYHVQLLHDAGLIVADELVPGQWWPERITWAGHEFLDLARDESVWREVTRDVEEAVGSAPFTLVSKRLTGIVDERMSAPRTRRK